MSLVSDMGDLTNPARGRGSRNAVTDQQKITDLIKNKANELQKTDKGLDKTLVSTVTAVNMIFIERTEHTALATEDLLVLIVVAQHALSRKGSWETGHQDKHFMMGSLEWQSGLWEAGKGKPNAVNTHQPFRTGKQ